MNNVLITHDKSELESILRLTGNNCSKPIQAGNKELTNYVSCIGDIVGELNIDTNKYYVIMSDIIETDKRYTFTLKWFSMKHGAHAMYCIESINHRSINIKISK